jgi:Subtilase family
MCDEAGGEVIVSFPPHDPVGLRVLDWVREHGESHGVTHMSSLEEWLSDIPLGPEGQGIRLPEIHRFLGPEGEEETSAALLRDVSVNVALALGANAANDLAQPFAFQAAPNRRVSLLTGTPRRPAPHVSFTEFHATYKALLGFDPGRDYTRGKGIRIAIVDSGISDSSVVHVSRRVDFAADHPWGRPVAGVARDGYGHGTAVAEIVADLLPDADFVIYKVANDAGEATEWELLAALARTRDVDVVNLSLAFGWDGPDCPVCGRRANSARSMVFEHVLRGIMDRGPSAPIVVAAAGNGAKAGLAYPARYSDVVAVGSISSAGTRSSFSNWGALDHLARTHRNVFFLPGGNLGPAPEYVAIATDGVRGRELRRFAGTSFACAYATAVIGATLGLMGSAHALKYLRSTAMPLAGGTAEEYGNGLMRFD